MTASEKSAGISPRRALLEEILEERSKAVAGLPIDEQEPSPWSWQWKAGITALLAPMSVDLRVRRRVALNVAVVALAWLEAIDRDPRARDARREA